MDNCIVICVLIQELITFNRNNMSDEVEDIEKAFSPDFGVGRESEEEVESVPHEGEENEDDIDNSKGDDEQGVSIAENGQQDGPGISKQEPDKKAPKGESFLFPLIST